MPHWVRLFMLVFLILSTSTISGQGYTIPADLNGNGTPDYLEAGSVPSISLHPVAVDICSGENTSFSVSATGSDVEYQWQYSANNGVSYSNILAAGLNPTYGGFNSSTLTLADVPNSEDDNLYRVLVIETSFVCDTSVSNAALLNVRPTPVAPTGVAAQSFCAIDSPTISDLVASGTGLIWYYAPNGAAPISSGTALNEAFSYMASQTIGGCESEDRLTVSITIDDPLAPSGDATQDFCSIDNPTVADLSATGTDIQWYANSSGGTALSSTTALSTATTYYSSQTISSCESDTRFAVAVTIAIPSAPTASSNQPFCAIDTPTLDDISVSGTDVQWYAASTGGSPLAGSTTLVNSTTYFASQTLAACESDTRRSVLVTVFDPPAPSGASSQAFCSIDNPTISDFLATPSMQWYSAATGGSPLAGTASLTNGVTYYASNTQLGCESDERHARTASISDPSAPTGAASQSFCSIDLNDLDDVSVAGTSIIWYDAAAAGNMLPGSTTLVDGTTYYATQTVSSCESVSRLAVTTNVADPAAPTGDATQDFCSIDLPTVADLVATGTGVQWYAGSTGGTALAATTALSTATSYFATQTIGLCESDTRFEVAVTINDPLAPTGDATQDFCATSTPTIADLTATGTAVQWYANAIGGSPLASTVPVQDGVAYYATQTVSSCESDTRLTVTVSIGDPAAPAGDANQDFCTIDTPDLNDITVVGTGITWYANATGGSALSTTTALVDGATYYASQNPGTCESTSRLAVTTAVADPAAPTGTSAQNFCSIDLPTVAQLTATGTGVQWYANATGGTALAATTALTTATSYYASQTIGLCESDTRFEVAVTINDPAAPTGTAAQNFCSIDLPTVAQLLATGTGVQWYANATGGTALATTTALTTATSYYASQTIGLCESDTRFEVAVTINDPLAPAGDATQDFCSIDLPTVAQLVATGTGVQWYANATGGTALSTTTALTTSTSYYASQTVGSCESDTRFEVAVTINDPLAPTGTTAQDFCSIDLPTVAQLTATGTGVQWYANATGGTALSTTTALTTSTSYYASQTVGSCESDTRFEVAVTINDPLAPTGTTAQDFCSIDLPTVAQLTATGTGVQWYANATGGTALAATTALTTSTSYYASQTVGSCESDTRFEVAVTINDPLAPTGTTAQDFCSIDLPTVAQLVATGTGVQWYANATGGTALAATTALTTATSYYASQTVGSCESDTRFEVAVTINDPGAPTGDATQDFCSIDLPTVAQLVATGTGVQWYANATGGTALAATTGLTTATSYYASQTVGSCESDTRFEVAVTINDPAAPTGDATQDFCATSTPTIADLTATGTAVQWYANAIGGSPLASTVPVLDGVAYYATQTVSSCESDTRLMVTVSIGDPAAPAGDANQDFCTIDTPDLNDITVVGTGITWYANATGGSALSTTTALVDGATYYASQNPGTCESTSRLAVTTAVADPAAPTGTAAQNFCSIDLPTVAQLVATGTGVQWYANATGGTALAATTALTTATSYYASQTVGSCESDTRFEVAVTINDPLAPTGTTAQDFCSIDLPTVAQLVATGTGVQWYANATGGTALATTTALTTATSYYASQTIGLCESDTRFEVAVTINDPLAPAGDATQDFCSIDLPTIAQLVATGTGVQWYANATGGTALSTTTALTTSTSYYASQTVGSCESDTRFEVAVTINDPLAPTGTTAQDFCSIDLPTVAQLVATGTGVQWYAGSTGGTSLSSTVTLVDGTDYFASQTVGTCESDTRFAVAVTVEDPSAPTGTAAQDFCSIDLPTVADLVAAGAGVQWYASSTGGTALVLTTALADATSYYASQTVGSCESDTRFEVAVTIADPVAPTGTSAQSFCSIDGNTVADLTVNESNITWYDAASGGTVLAITEALVNSTTYYAAQTVGSCESDTRFAVTVTIADPSAPSSSGLQQFCVIEARTIADLSPSGANIIWYDAASGGSVVNSSASLVDGAFYYASQTAGGCESISRLEVEIRLNNTPAPTGTLAQDFCASTDPRVADLVASGTTLRWFEFPTGGLPLAASTMLQDTKSYYASQNNGTCESSNRFQVDVTLTNPAAPTGLSSQYFCPASNPTLDDISVSTSNLEWYDAPTGGNTLLSTTALSNGVTYYASQVVGVCPGTNTFAIGADLDDVTAPVAICQTTTLNLGGGTATLNAIQVDGGSTDDCGITTYDVTPNSFTTAGTHSVTLTVTDAAGNSDQCTLNITVEDTDEPVAVCQNIDAILDIDGNVTIDPQDLDGGSTDNGAVVGWSANLVDFTCADLGINASTLTVTDNSGLSSNCVAQVTVIDNIAPMVLCQDITVELDASGSVSIDPSDIDNGTTDNCDFTLDIDISDFDCADATGSGEVVVTLTATDDSGNSSTCTAIVTVEDNIMPDLVCTNPIITVTDPGQCTAVVNYTPPSVSDNCNPAIVAQPSTGHAPGFAFSEGVTFVGYYANNPSNGLTVTCSFPVTVNDEEDPEITCPSNIVVDSEAGVCGATVTYIEPVGTDNCTGSTTTQTGGTLQPGDFFPVGVTTLEYTTEDDSGNTSVCSFTVTVNDNELPVISSCPSNVVTDNDAGACGAVVSFSAPIATDNCSGMTVVRTDGLVTLDSGDEFPVGTSTIIYTISDAAGNSVICSFDITVNDTEAPIAVCQDISVNLGAGSVSISPSDVFNALASSDNCPTVTPIAVTPNTFTEVGCTNVTLTVEDAAGNTATCIAEVCVVDDLEPIALCIPGGITVFVDEFGNVTVAGEDLDNGSTDNGVIVSYEASPANFNCDDLGVNPITLIVTDDGGNSASCSTTVTVLDNTPPVAMCQTFFIALDENGEATITPDMIDNGSSDNCGIATYALDITTFDCDDVGGNSVTLTVTDASGNSDGCSVFVSVLEVTAPTITCPTSVSVSNDPGLSTATIVIPMPVVDDNCGIQSLVNDFNSTDNASDTYPIGITNITWVVTDVNGNTAECTFSVNVQDSDGPDPDCPDNVDVDADLGACDTFVSIPVPQPTDNDGIASIVNDFNNTDNASGTYPVGTTEVIWTVTDNNGNSVQCQQFVTVNDNQDPTDVVCPPSETFSATIGECGIDSALVTLTAPTATDNCGTITITNDAPSYYNIGETTVTWTIADGAGNTVLCPQVVTITDSEGPVSATCPGDIVVDNDAGECGAVITYTTPTGTDPCGAVTVTLVSGQLSNTSFPIGTTEVIYELEDVNGNITLCSFEVIVNDIESPVITPPTDVAITPGAQDCEYIVTFSDPAVSDNCPGVTLTQTDGTGLESGDVFPVGTTTLCYYALDENGNDAILCFNIEVTDIIAPVLTDCPTGVQVLADTDGCSATVTLPVPTAEDDCGMITMTVDTLSSTFDVGSTTVTWTIADQSGNTILCSYEVVVTDDQLPTITCPNDTSIVAPYGDCDLALVLTAPSASDNCGIASITNDFNGTADASDTYPLGQTTVTWTAVDVNGNSSTCEVIVTVDTPTDPVITCPDDVTVDTDPDQCSADVTVGAVILDVPCSIVSVVNDINGTDNASDNYPLGSTTVVWTVTDTSGNTTICETIVTVEDNQAPIIICPVDITVGNDPGLCGAYVSYPGVTATDNCQDPTIALQSGPASGEWFEVGTTPVTYEITDQSGEITNCTFNVTVVDDEAPQIECPEDIVSVDSLIFYDIPTFFDNCGADMVLVAGLDSGMEFEHGDTEVTYMAFDAAGNSVSCSFNVLVNTPPVGVNDTIVIIEPIGPFDIDVLDNDYDLDGDSIFIFEILYGEPYATINDSIEITYNDPNIECGLDSVIYVVMDEHFATDTATVYIEVQCLDLFIPEGFSPNGDGVNDFFEILGLVEYPNNRLTVYNRYGHEVFNRTGYENDWDGTSEADLTIGNGRLPRGTYFYLLDLDDGKGEPIKGFIYINPR